MPRLHLRQRHGTDRQRRAEKGMENARYDDQTTHCVTAPLLHMHVDDAFIRIQPGAGKCVTTDVRVVELNPAGSPHPTPNNLHG